MTEIEKAQKTFWDGCVQHIRDTYSGLNGKRVYIYGSGEFGRFLAKVLVEYECMDQRDLRGFINDFENGFCIDGIPVLPFEKCDFSGSDYCVVVGVMMNATAIAKRLEERKIIHLVDTYSGMRNVSGPMLCVFDGHSNDSSIGNMLAKIKRFHYLNLPEKEMESFFEDEQSLAVLHNRLELYRTGEYKLLDAICPVTTVEYFENDLLEIGEHEIYVDCGAYNGDSVLDFISHTRAKYNRVVAFEPDSANFASMKEKLHGLSKIELVNTAIGQISCKTRFNAAGGMGGFVDLEYGTQMTEMICLDDYFHEPVTFIKMDIEGAELDALKGAERLLKEYRPKLAICVYHKVEDIFTIPKFIKSVVPGYRLKL